MLAYTCCSMSQLLSLVTQMHGNEGVTNINYDTDVRTTERFVANADPQNILVSPIDGGYLCSDPISTYYNVTTYDSARGITSMRQKRLDELREIHV